MNEMLKQAQQLQKDMEDAQKRLETEEIEVSSGGGAVKIKITGSGKITSITLSEELSKADKASQESTLLAAIQEAVSAGKKKHEEEMRKITDSLQLPGMGEGGGLPDLGELDLGGPKPRGKQATEGLEGMDRV